MSCHPVSVRSALRAAVIAAAVAIASGASAEPANRIVSIGGAVTEILFALGAEDRIAAVDSTSTYPPAAAEKPDVGYMRALSAEGVLSVGPDLVLAEQGSGPPEALAVVRGAVPVLVIPNIPSERGVAAKIRAVGAAIGRPAEADALAEEVTTKFAALAGAVARIGPRKRVLFLLSASGGRMMAGGRGTAADAIIRLAGGVNAAADMEGFKPMVDEAVLAAAPDVVVMMDRGEHALDPAALFALPALRGTPAAASRALVLMDGLTLLGFGPRTPQAARDLAAAIYPGAIAAGGRP